MSRERRLRAFRVYTPAICLDTSRFRCRVISLSRTLLTCSFAVVG